MRVAGRSAEEAAAKVVSFADFRAKLGTGHSGDLRFMPMRLPRYAGDERHRGSRGDRAANQH